MCNGAAYYSTVATTDWQEIIDSPFVQALLDFYRKDLKTIFNSYAQADQVKADTHR